MPVAAEEEEILDTYFSAASYRVDNLRHGPAGRPRALLQDYQLAPLHVTAACAPSAATNPSADWRTPGPDVPPLPNDQLSRPVPVAAGTRTRPQPRQRPGSVVARPTSSSAPASSQPSAPETKPRGWRRMFGLGSAPDRGHTQADTSDKSFSGRRLFGRKPKPSLLPIPPPQSPKDPKEPTSPVSVLRTPSHAVATLLDTKPQPPSPESAMTPYAPSTDSSVPAGLTTAETSVNSLIVAGPSSATGSTVKKRITLPHPPSSFKHGATPTIRPIKERLPATFTFDPQAAQKEGAIFWDHLSENEVWPALLTPAESLTSPLRANALHYRSPGPARRFLQRLSKSELLLLYSLGALDANDLPPISRAGTLQPLDPANVAEMDVLPKPTEYASALLDEAVGHLVDSFMATRATYLHHASSRAGRYVGTLTQVRSDTRSNAQPSMRFTPSVDEPIECTESLSHTIEDATAASLVEAHVELIRSLSSLSDPRVPAPLLLWERRRVALMHLHRPLHTLYNRVFSSVVAQRDAERQAATDQLAMTLQSVLVQLEDALPPDQNAYLAVVDERYAVPIAGGSRLASAYALRPRPRLFSPEAHTLLNEHAGLLVPDCTLDNRFTPPPVDVKGKSVDDTELGSTRFFASLPVCSAAGIPLAVVCVTGSVPLADSPSRTDAKNVWSEDYAVALNKASTDAAMVLEHTLLTWAQVDKKRMIDHFFRLQAGIATLGLIQDGPNSLSDARSRRTEPMGAVGFPAGLDEEVKNDVEQEHVRSVYLERTELSSRLDGDPALKKVANLLTRAVAHGFGGDMVYLARRTVAWRKASADDWTIVAHHSAPNALLQDDMLDSIPLDANAHDVSDHRGLPALFHDVRSSSHQPALPWQVPLGPQRAYGAGAMVTAGIAKDGQHSSSSIFLLVALFKDPKRLLSSSEQSYLAALAAIASSWLRQADGLDQHLQSLTTSPQAPLSPPRTTRASPRSTKASIMSSVPGRWNRQAASDRASLSVDQAPASVPASDLPLNAVRSRPDPPVFSPTIQADNPVYAAAMAAAVFAPATERTRQEEAELGQAAALMMQNAYSRRRQKNTSPSD